MTFLFSLFLHVSTAAQYFPLKALLYVFSQHIASSLLLARDLPMNGHYCGLNHYLTPCSS